MCRPVPLETIKQAGLILMKGGPQKSASPARPSSPCQTVDVGTLSISFRCLRTSLEKRGHIPSLPWPFSPTSLGLGRLTRCLGPIPKTQLSL